MPECHQQNRDSGFATESAGVDVAELVVAARVTDPVLSAIWMYSPSEPGNEVVLREYLRALAGLDHCCDLTIVVNGGTQHTHRVLMDQLSQEEIPCRIVSLHRDCDEATMLQAGIAASQGELLAVLPPYLQTDPRALRDMLHEIERGADLVISWRYPRVDSRWTAFKSYLFNALTRRVTGCPLHDLNSGLRLIRRTVMEHVPVYGDLLRYLPILADVKGFRVAEVKARHLEELVKKGDYRFGVYIRRLFDLLALFFLFKFTQKPLRFFGLIGSTTLGVGLVLSIAIAIQRWFGVAMADRPLLLLTVLLFVLGVQLVSLGLLGELIIFTHGTGIRHHNVEEVYEQRGEA